MSLQLLAIPQLDKVSADKLLAESKLPVGTATMGFFHVDGKGSVFQVGTPEGQYEIRDTRHSFIALEALLARAFRVGGPASFEAELKKLESSTYPIRDTLDFRASTITLERNCAFDYMREHAPDISGCFPKVTVRHTALAPLRQQCNAAETALSGADFNVVPLIHPWLQERLEAAVLQDSTIRNAVLEPLIRLREIFRATSEAYHLTLRNEGRHTVVQVLDIPGVVAARQEVAHVIATSKVSHRLRDTILRELARPPLILMALYCDGGKAPPCLPVNRTMLKAALEARTGTGDVVAFNFDLSLGLSEAPAFMAPANTPDYRPAHSLRVRMSFPNQAVTFFAPKRNVDLAQHYKPSPEMNFGSLSVPEQYRAFESIRGRADQILRHGAPIIIPDHARLQFPNPKGEEPAHLMDYAEQAAGYGMTTWYWLHDRVLPSDGNGNATLAIWYRVRWHTRVSSALEEADSSPCMVVSRTIVGTVNGTSVRLNQVLLNKRGEQERENLGNLLGGPVEVCHQPEDDSYWIDENHIRELHGALTHFPKLDADTPAEERTRAYDRMVRAKLLNSLVHFDYVPCFDLRNEAWTNQAFARRVTQ